MKNFFLIIILFSASSFLFSQGISDSMLFGDVKSGGGSYHIPYATIMVKGTNMGTVADGTGHFKLVHLPIGKNTIIARAIGYQQQEIEVDIRRGEVKSVIFQLKEDILNLQEIVVTGTRSEHSLKDVPVRTELITSRSLEIKNANTLYQALEGIPGVRVENQCQSCNFTMVRMQGLGAEHTQVLINGMPVYSGLAGVYGLQQVSTVDIDRIEVVKGAGSALYGSGSIAGAINIITKEPSHIPASKLDVQLGKYNTNKYSFSSSIRNEKGNAGLHVFAQRYTEGAIDETGHGTILSQVRQKDGESDRVESKLNNIGFALFFDDAISKNDKLIIRGKSVFENRDGGTLDDDYYRNPLTDGTESISTDRYEASLNYEKSIGLHSGLDFGISWALHKRNATSDAFLSDYMDIFEEVPDLRIMRPYLATENSFSALLSYNTLIGNHRLIAGIQGFITNLDESGMYVVTDSESKYYGAAYRSLADKYARESGIFIQDEWSVNERLMVVPGFRVDRHESGEKYSSDQEVFNTDYFPETNFDKTSFNPRIAIRYKLTEKITLRANGGTGFRNPYGFSEDLHLCSGSPRVWKSSSLKPERSLSLNLSADYYTNVFRFSANYFRTYLRDKIDFNIAGAEVAALGYDYQWENIDDAMVQGLELTVVATIARNLKLGIDATMNRGEYKNERTDWAGTKFAEISRYISRFPSRTGNVKLEYTPKSWTFTLTGNYQGALYIDYNSEEDLSSIIKTQPYILFNARASKDLGNLRIYAGANNIFNYVQKIRYLDDPAFIYAPLYGSIFYAGASINIKH